MSFLEAKALLVWRHHLDAVPAAVVMPYERSELLAAWQGMLLGSEESQQAAALALHAAVPDSDALADMMHSKLDSVRSLSVVAQQAGSVCYSMCCNVSQYQNWTCVRRRLPNSGSTLFGCMQELLKLVVEQQTRPKVGQAASAAAQAVAELWASLLNAAPELPSNVRQAFPCLAAMLVDPRSPVRSTGAHLVSIVGAKATSLGMVHALASTVPAEDKVRLLQQRESITDLHCHVGSHTATTH